MECLSKIPYTSLLGFILVVIGSAVMSATLYDSLNRTDEMMDKFFFKVNNIGTAMMIMISFVAVLITSCLFALFFAFIGTMATRNKIYHRNRCILGGRKTAAILMCFLFFANIIWIIFMCIMTVPVIVWLMISSNCRNEIAIYETTKSFHYTFSLRNYGIYPDKSQKNITNIDIYKEFCRLVSTIGPLYTCSIIGSLVVIIGLITFIASLSSLYMRLKYTKELTNFIVAYEDQKTNELDYIVNAKAM